MIIPTADHFRLQRALIEHGYLIVAEFDDDPLHFADLVASDFFALRSCHCVQTTTELLAATLRAYNPHVQVFPNQVAELPPPTSFPTARARERARPTTLFFGALNREADWAPVMPALNRVLRDRRGRVRVQVVYDRAFFDALETEDKVFEPLCTYDRYHALLGQADVAFLPLEPTRFNRHKSDLKFLESAAHRRRGPGQPHGLCRGDPPRRDRPDLRIARRFRRAVDPVDRRRYPSADGWRRTPIAYVAEHRLLAGITRTRHAWYRSMLDRLPELNRELRGGCRTILHLKLVRAERSPSLNSRWLLVRRADHRCTFRTPLLAFAAS